MRLKVIAPRRLVAALLAVSAGLALPASQGLAAEEAPCGPRCIPVEIVTARLSAFRPSIALTGGIQPKFQSNIGFRVSGNIAARLAEVGDHVGADQVLARLDPREQTAQLDSAKAGLGSAQALLTQAKVAFDRQQKLYKEGYATRPSYDQAEQQLRTQTANVESAEAALGTAREQFGYTDLKAGVSGIITARSAEVGQVVQAGQTVFTVAQDGARDAVFDVYEVLLAQPYESRTVHVALQSDPSVTANGTIREIAPSVDTASGTVKVKVALDPVPPRMTLGAAVVGWGDFRPVQAIVIPRGALFRWQDKPAVWLYDPKTSTVAPKVVALERYDGTDLILSGGVAPGDHVVTAGIQFLTPGAQVGVTSPEATQDAKVGLASPEGRQK